MYTNWPLFFKNWYFFLLFVEKMLAIIKSQFAGLKEADWTQNGDQKGPKAQRNKARLVYAWCTDSVARSMCSSPNRIRLTVQCMDRWVPGSHAVHGNSPVQCLSWHIGAFTGSRVHSWTWASGSSDERRFGQASVRAARARVGCGLDHQDAWLKCPQRHAGTHARKELDCLHVTHHFQLPKQAWWKCWLST